jgi:hypothetical protein
VDDYEDEEIETYPDMDSLWPASNDIDENREQIYTFNHDPIRIRYPDVLRQLGRSKWFLGECRLLIEYIYNLRDHELLAFLRSLANIPDDMQCKDLRTSFRNVFQLYIRAILERMFPGGGQEFETTAAEIRRHVGYISKTTEVHVYTIEDATTGEVITFEPRQMDYTPSDFHVAFQMLDDTYDEKTPESTITANDVDAGFSNLLPLKDVFGLNTLDEYRGALEWVADRDKDTIYNDLLAREKMLKQLQQSSGGRDVLGIYFLEVDVLFLNTLLDALTSLEGTPSDPGDAAIMQSPRTISKIKGKRLGRIVYGDSVNFFFIYGTKMFGEAHAIKPLYNPYIRSYYSNSRLASIGKDLASTFNGKKKTYIKKVRK